MDTTITNNSSPFPSLRGASVLPLGSLNLFTLESHQLNFSGVSLCNPLDIHPSSHLQWIPSWWPWLHSSSYSPDFYNGKKASMLHFLCLFFVSHLFLPSLSHTFVESSHSLRFSYHHFFNQVWLQVRVVSWLGWSRDCIRNLSIRLNLLEVVLIREPFIVHTHIFIPIIVLKKTKMKYYQGP